MGYCNKNDLPNKTMATVNNQGLCYSELFRTTFTFFGENFDFWTKNWFFAKILIFSPNFHVWTKFWILPRFWFLARFWFLPRFWSLTKILIFGQDFDFWLKFWFFPKIFVSSPKFTFISNFKFLKFTLAYGNNVITPFLFWSLTSIGFSLERIVTNAAFDPRNLFQFSELFCWSFSWTFF